MFAGIHKMQIIKRRRECSMIVIDLTSGNSKKLQKYKIGNSATVN